MASFFNFLKNSRSGLDDTGYYFITICTRRRFSYFGSIVNGHVELSLIGKIVKFELAKMARKRDELMLEDWIIMPNHVHLLLGPYPDELKKAIYRFKSSVKSWTNLCGFDFYWQIRFYEHQIKDEPELQRIKWYIRKNPVVWKSDTLNQENELNLPKHQRWATGDKRYWELVYAIQ